MQSVAGEVIFTSENFSSDNKCKARTGKYTNSYPYLIFTNHFLPILPRLSFAEEVPVGDFHCRIQQQRRHHQPCFDQAFGVVEDPLLAGKLLHRAHARKHYTKEQIYRRLDRVAQDLKFTCWKTFASVSVLLQGKNSFT